MPFADEMQTMSIIGKYDPSYQMQSRGDIIFLAKAE